MHPHKSACWEYPRIENWEDFESKTEEICELLEKAEDLAAQNVHLESVDEKTGVQALERNAPTIEMRSGLDERREFEYTRHGTWCLIGNLEVASGKLVHYTIGLTRTEEDFARHIAERLRTDPKGEWIFLLDNLNTHKSESLVVLTAKHLDLPLDSLGEKGKSGVLKSMESRQAFLEDKTHSVRFVYTPKHCSWLNPIENWFGILEKKALKRGNFKSLEDLKSKIIRFIEYYNTLSKAFKWKAKAEGIIKKMKSVLGIAI